jgi:hypothetical protein
MSRLNFLYSFQTTELRFTPFCHQYHVAGGYCFAFLHRQWVAPSGACIGAGIILGARRAALRSGPMLHPTYEPTSGALSTSSSGGISCAPTGAI